MADNASVGAHFTDGPARRVITRGARRSQGRFVSRKARGSIQWDSTLERDFLLLAEFDPTIRSVHEQPCKVNVYLEGKLRTAYPDFLVTREDRLEVHEVKTQEADIPDEQAQVYRKVEALLRERGYGFRLTFAADIRAEPLLSNAKVLLRHRDRRLSLLTEFMAIEMVTSRPGLTSSQLCSHTQLTPIEVLALVASGKLEADLRHPLTDGTRLWRRLPDHLCRWLLPYA